MNHDTFRRSGGFALLTVLILLTIMLLAGMALFRSADTAGMIAGNAAAKQAASQVGNIGLVDAQKKIDAGTLVAGAGYSEQAVTADSAGIPTAGTWSTAVTTPTGYTYDYLVEKLCTAAGVCAQAESEGSAAAGVGVSLGPQGSGLTSPIPPVDLYRVTVRVTGPRNLTSYVQAVYGK